MGFLFLLAGMGYRHQFIYIYPKGPDSGGKIFLSFLNFVITCILVAELTVTGLLGIKKAPIAAALMFPLIIVTIFFVVYIKQKHLSHPEYLPARRCIIVDLENEEHGKFDDSFVYRAYTHPDLRTEKEALPENMTVAGSRDEGQSIKEDFHDEHPSLDDEDSQDESPSAAGVSRDEDPSTVVISNMDEHKSTFDSKNHLPNDDDRVEEDENKGYSV
jgi:hypothetical protein